MGGNALFQRFKNIGWGNHCHKTNPKVAINYQNRNALGGWKATLSKDNTQ